jgi:hypothetical protein
VPPSSITLEHEDFTKNKDNWELYRHSAELTGGYKASTQTYTGPDSAPRFDETYLIPHAKEADYNDFARRVAAARPPRFVREGIESITGILTKEEPNRDNYPDKLSTWTTGVDAKGSTLQQWIAKYMWPLVERYGLCYSFARRPTIDGANLADQEKRIKDAGLPEVLLLIITPENMPWWSVDELGRFEIVRYTEQKVDSKTEEGYAVEDREYTRHWWITHEGWWYADEKDYDEQALKVEAVGTWNKGGAPMDNFPIVKWGLKDDIGPTATASLASKRSNPHLRLP